MTNEQKYTTTEERVRAFAYYCSTKDGCERKFRQCDEVRCFVHWLYLPCEEEEKPMPCYECGGEEEGSGDGK